MVQCKQKQICKSMNDNLLSQKLLYEQDLKLIEGFNSGNVDHFTEEDLEFMRKRIGLWGAFLRDIRNTLKETKQS